MLHICFSKIKRSKKSGPLRGTSPLTSTTQSLRSCSDHMPSSMRRRPIYLLPFSTARSPNAAAIKEPVLPHTTALASCQVCLVCSERTRGFPGILPNKRRTSTPPSTHETIPHDPMGTHGWTFRGANAMLPRRCPGSSICSSLVRSETQSQLSPMPLSCATVNRTCGQLKAGHFAKRPP